ncbi:MAG: DUF4301 family protein [Elusimicrobia bacterium]|nr:DUF4301 family protein [Elusimicrobiota bacterium]
MLSERDIEKIYQHGIPEAEARRQLEVLRRTPPYVELDRPCRVGDGILSLSEEDLSRLRGRGERAQAAGRLTKFVPASGRASRMFHALLALRGRRSPPSPEEIAEAETCFKELSKFAFYADLKSAMKRDGLDAGKLAAEGRYVEIADYLLGPEGLGYGELPKALLCFHRAGEGPRTALEEHLLEAAAYVRDQKGVCRVHFTVPPGSLPRFKSFLEEAAPRHEKRLKASFEATFSTQKLSTDTVVVGADNELFRPAENELLFWAGGHGALLDNLNALRGDVVFIKNVDNVIPDELMQRTCLYKLALAGLLLELQEALFGYLSRIYSKTADEAALEEALRFAEKRLHVQRPPGWESIAREARRAFLIDRLDRPLRVCGVVPNTGEPGGGPFWTRGKDGTSLQIVEKAQVEPSGGQKAVFASATHFNPVDIVCGLRDYLGEPFNLRRFRDPGAVCISEKAWEGRRIRILEHPGLWNGGMARWLTVFVDIPLWTFHPVKTLADLLKEGHQHEG